MSEETEQKIRTEINYIGIEIVKPKLKNECPF
jgi:hypothetical protein